MQDCWILRTPSTILKLNAGVNNLDFASTASRLRRFEALVQRTHFYFGRIGADNQLAMSLRSSGYDLSNPSLRLSIYHEHNSRVRTYTAQDKVSRSFAKYEEEGVAASESAVLLTDSLC